MISLSYFLYEFLDYKFQVQIIQRPGKGHPPNMSVVCPASSHSFFALLFQVPKCVSRLPHLYAGDVSIVDQ